MIVKLPITGASCCCAGETIVIKVKDPTVLVINESATSYQYFINGTIIDVVKGCFNKYYAVEIADALIVDAKQLYANDFSKWSCGGILVDYIKESLSQEVVTASVYTDATLTGNGLAISPLSINIDIIDGRH